MAMTTRISTDYLNQLREMMIMNKEFKTYLLNEEGIARVAHTKQAFDALLETLKIVCPEGREFAIVKTKLEEASFFAAKAISLDSRFSIEA